jgi:hypothetical protein
MSGTADVLYRAADLIRARGLARGYWASGGQVDAAGAVYMAAGDDLADFTVREHDKTYTGPGCRLYPHYASEETAAQVKVAFRALCELAAFIDPLFGPHKPTLEIVERRVGWWSDHEGNSAAAVADQLEAAAAAAAAAAKAGSPELAFA